MKRWMLITLLIIGFQYSSLAQSGLPDSCRLNMGMNLGGLSDYTTEMPLVDLMHHCRKWFTFDVGNLNTPWDTDAADSIAYRSVDGYPTHSPQQIPGHSYPQGIMTGWGDISGWKTGTYVCLFDGIGQIDIFLSVSNVTLTNPGRIIFDIQTPQVGDVVALRILQSDSTDPIRNIRILMPGHESTYASQPFNPDWLQRLTPFSTLRFMDWGQTNGWGCNDDWSACSTDPTLYPWSSRAQMSSYTWANEKGIPYEMMIRLCNQLQKDMWICVPHNADSSYIVAMATFLRDSLNSGLRIYVEYSNEIWNWMFTQAQFLNNFGNQNVPWPERIVPYIQRVHDIFTSVFSNQSGRLIRVVGGQAGWLDVSKRIAFNMTPGSFDAFSVAAYFGISQQTDSIFDGLGSAVTVADVANRARIDRNIEINPWLYDHKIQIADSLNIPLIYYEGGQHLTPQPFGQSSTYDQALLDVMRDTAMYNLYDELFDTLRGLADSPNPSLFMNFSFVSSRSARYGSWGILETLNQDTSVIPAPKYRALLNNIYNCSSLTALYEAQNQEFDYKLWPNPVDDHLRIQFPQGCTTELYAPTGKLIHSIRWQQSPSDIDMSNYASGLYLIRILNTEGQVVHTAKVVIQH